MKINLKTCSNDKLLQVLKSFSTEACNSMQDGDGLRAGLYLRRIEEALSTRKIKAVVIDDADMTEGCVYTSSM